MFEVSETINTSTRSVARLDAIIGLVVDWLSENRKPEREDTSFEHVCESEGGMVKWSVAQHQNGKNLVKTEASRHGIVSTDFCCREYKIVCAGLGMEPQNLEVVRDQSKVEDKYENPDRCFDNRKRKHTNSFRYTENGHVYTVYLFLVHLFRKSYVAGSAPWATAIFFILRPQEKISKLWRFELLRGNQWELREWRS